MTSSDLIKPEKNNNLAPASILEQAGQAANKAAGAGIFTDYQARKAPNTLRRHAADLALFAKFLKSAGVPCGDLQNNPQAWRGVSWGLVKAFQAWQLKQGYALGSVNGRLSTVKVYAGLAALAGVIDPGEIVLIKSVKGYEHKERKHINDKRAAAGLETRKGAKKAEAVTLTTDQAEAMTNQPDTDQGRRDNLLMCLMLRLGLRVGEVAALTVDCFELKAGELRFYRPKVDKVQTHKLDEVTLNAARAYLAEDAPTLGNVWRGSVKGHGLGKQGMSERAITKRVELLGRGVGVAGLSAHDCRHYWATQAARNGTALDRLQDAGGWASLAMPGRYIQAAKIANQGVRLD